MLKAAGAAFPSPAHNHRDDRYAAARSRIRPDTSAKNGQVASIHFCGTVHRTASPDRWNTSPYQDLRRSLPLFRRCVRIYTIRLLGRSHTACSFPSRRTFAVFWAAAAFASDFLVQPLLSLKKHRGQNGHTRSVQAELGIKKLHPYIIYYLSQSKLDAPGQAMYCEQFVYQLGNIRCVFPL